MDGDTDTKSSFSKVSERGGEKKEKVEGVNSSMIYLIHYKNFCKCHDVPPPSTTILKKQQNKETSQSDRMVV
jgi:hypothetical protein